MCYIQYVILKSEYLISSSHFFPPLYLKRYSVPMKCLKGSSEIKKCVESFIHVLHLSNSLQDQATFIGVSIQSVRWPFGLSLVGISQTTAVVSICDLQSSAMKSFNFLVLISLLPIVTIVLLSIVPSVQTDDQQYSGECKTICPRAIKLNNYRGVVVVKAS